MPRLATILTGDEPGTQVLRLVLDHYDLHNFGGMWSLSGTERLARMAFANAKLESRWGQAVRYHLFYQEWTDIMNAVHREAELEVTVL